MNNPSKVTLIEAVTIGLLAWLCLYVPSSRAQEEKRELSLGERFHQETSVTRDGIAADRSRSKPDKPAPFKTYPDAPEVELPPPDFRGMTVEESLLKRRSRRNYTDKAMSVSDLSQLLFSAQGVTGKTSDHLLRTAPSAGALYPYEIYVVVMNVKDIDQGIYHYAVQNHRLELIKSGDFREKMASAALSQEVMNNADIIFVLSAIFDRTRHKYGERGVRYVYIEAGHISQNIFLQAVSLKLGSVCVGAFFDQKVNELIGIDGRKEAAIYLHAVGA